MPVSKVDAEALESLYAVRRRCRDHCVGRKAVGRTCPGLADSTVRQIHWINSGALDAGDRWKWASINYAARAKKPAVPRPNPERFCITPRPSCWQSPRPQQSTRSECRQVGNRAGNRQHTFAAEHARCYRRTSSSAKDGW